MEIELVSIKVFNRSVIQIINEINAMLTILSMMNELQRIQQAEWLEKYQSLLGTDPIWDPDVIPTLGNDVAEDDEPAEVSLDSLRELLELGVGIAPHPALEKALAKLQGLLEMSEKIEDKASRCLQMKYNYYSFLIIKLISNDLLLFI